MEIKFEKWNTTTVLFFITVLSLQDFAQLIPSSAYLVPGLLKFSDIGVICAILFFLWSYFGVRLSEPVSYRYGACIIFWLICITISSFMADRFFGQSVSVGLRSMRSQIACFLLYFPVTRMMKCGLLERKNIIKTLFIVGTFELIVYTLQFLLADIVTFTYISTSEVRYDSTRLRVPYLLPMILGLYCLNKIMTGKTNGFKSTLWNFIYVAWSAFLLMGICKHRAPSIILLCVFIVAYLMWRNDLSIKFVAGIVLVIIAVAFVSNSDIVTSTINGLLNSSSADNTMSIRDAGRTFYLNKLEQSPWFGFGYPNSTNSAAQSAAGVQYNYYLVDNGIFGFLYLQGIFGLIWLVWLFAKSYRMSWRLYKGNISYLYILYFIYETANLYIGMHWFFNYTLPFVMVLVLLESEYEGYMYCEEEDARKIETDEVDSSGERLMGEGRHI